LFTARTVCDFHKNVERTISVGIEINPLTVGGPDGETANLAAIIESVWGSGDISKGTSDVAKVTKVKNECPPDLAPRYRCRIYIDMDFLKPGGQNMYFSADRDKKINAPGDPVDIGEGMYWNVSE
jgi:hypothetical protein